MLTYFVELLLTTYSLNVVALRIGHAYGPYVNFGISAFPSSPPPPLTHPISVPTLITVASVYGYLKKPMKSL